jgi:hypothetical protein
VLKAASRRNQWQVADCEDFIAVDAGADAVHPEDGLFGIYRHEAGKPHPTPPWTQSGSPTQALSRSPMARSAHWASPRFGNLQFTSESGVTGTFHTTRDTFTLHTTPGG